MTAGGQRGAPELFPRLPWVARQSLVALAGLRNRRRRYGRHYRRQLARLADSETCDPGRHAALQSELLDRLLGECARDSPYYRDAFAALDAADLAEIARHRDLEALPLLDKKTLRHQTRRVMSRRRRPLVWSSTSGSTGSPLTVAYDLESIQTSFAFLHRHRVWAGAGRWAPAVRLSGRALLPGDRARPPFWLANPAERMLLVSTYHLRPDFAPALSRRLRAYRPALLEGYPSALERLAALCPELAGLDSLVAVITTAETLSPDQRRAIERGFGVKVFDYYSASEGVPLIQECVAGALHLRLESGIFEVLDGAGRQVAAGEPGELVVTSFRQWMTPLVRYRTGDTVELAPAADGERCACGSTLPRAIRVLGRQDDLVLTADGREIGMFAYRTLKRVAGLEEAQIRQRGPRRFTVLAVAAAGARRDDLESRLRTVFADALGYRPVVELELVDEVPRGPGGKLRSVIRDWRPEEAATAAGASVPDPAARGERPRLVHVVTSPLTADRLLRGQLAHMRRAGLDVTLISAPGDGLERAGRREGVAVEPLAMRREIAPLADLASLWRLWRALRRLRPHLVNASTPKAGLLALVAARLAQVPARLYLLRGLRVETTRGLKRWLLASGERLAARAAHRVVAVGPSLAARFVELRLCPAERISVLGAGSSNGVHAPAADEEDARRLGAELGLTGGAPVVGFVGRLTRDKGLAELAAALDLLGRRFPGLRLLVVGDFERGDPVATTVAAALRSDSRVTITGFVADPSPYYRLMDVLAFPSHREGFPNAPLEAAMAGIPTVGFAVTGTVDAIVDGHTGRLVPPGDAAALAEGLAGYLARPTLAAEHGAAARRRAEEEFAPARVWTDLLALYRTMLSSRGLPTPAAGGGELSATPTSAGEGPR